MRNDIRQQRCRLALRVAGAAARDLGKREGMIVRLSARGHTREELGVYFSLTRERIKQLEQAAVAELVRVSADTPASFYHYERFGRG